jgi:hypothetical protein
MDASVVGQHKYLTAPVGKAKYPKPTGLDVALKDLERLGEKVLGFWREDDVWVFKVMA